MTLQPLWVEVSSVWKKMRTIFVSDMMFGGMKRSVADSGSESDENPQLLSNKIVPSPSVILRKSHEQTPIPPHTRMAK